MKVREVEIKVETLEQATKRAVSVMRRVQQGKKVKPREILAFEDLDTLRKVLTNERLRILHVLKTAKPENVRQLAKALKRGYANVYNDVKKLEELGLLEFEDAVMRRDPHPRFEKIHIEITV